MSFVCMSSCHPIARFLGAEHRPGSNSSSTISSLGVTKQQPYFEHNGRKIYSIADPPHVLKCVWNCLLKHTIETTEGTVRWSVIKEVYDLDKEQKIRLCPKLKEAHFRLKGFGAKMKVCWAAQVNRMP